MIKVVLLLLEDVIFVDIKVITPETVLEDEEGEVVVIVMMIRVVRVIQIDIEDTEEEVEAIHIEGVKEDIVIVMIQVVRVMKIEREKVEGIEDIVVDTVRNQVILPHIQIHIVKVQVSHHQNIQMKVNKI